MASVRSSPSRAATRSSATARPGRDPLSSGSPDEDERICATWSGRGLQPRLPPVGGVPGPLTRLRGRHGRRLPLPLDHHGSLVWPQAGLRAARCAGEPEALAAADREAIIAALHFQRRLGMSPIGHGQLRREHFESVVFDHIEGFGPAGGPQPLADAAGIAAARRAAPRPPQPRPGASRTPRPPRLWPALSDRSSWCCRPPGTSPRLAQLLANLKSFVAFHALVEGHCHTSASRSTAALGVLPGAQGSQRTVVDFCGHRGLAIHRWYR